MPPKPQRLCIFCGGAPVTGEHIFPEWMHPLLAGTDNQRFEISGRLQYASRERRAAKLAISDRMRSNERAYSLQVPVVCKVCNSGWMSVLENENMSALTALIKGEDILLTPAQQLSLARWFALKDMVYDASPNLGTPTYLSEELRAFGDRRELPTTLRIWIAPSVAKNWQVDNNRTAATLASDQTRAMGLHGFNVHTYTMAIRNLFAFAIYSRFPTESFLPVPDADYMVRIWPPENDSVAWSTRRQLSDEYLDRLDGLLANVLTQFELSMPHTTVALEVIEPSANATRFLLPRPGYIYGDDLTDLLCGRCSTVLCNGVSLQTLRDKLAVTEQRVLGCPSCSSFNHVPVKGTKRRVRARK
jgi:hypothetical protein